MVRKRAVQLGFMASFVGGDQSQTKLPLECETGKEDSRGNLRINRLLRRLVSSSGVPCTGRD